MPNKKSELTDKQKIQLVEGIIRQVIDIYTNNFYDIFEEDADIAFSMGGCEELAKMLKELFPEGQILYSSHHAVFNMCGMDFDIRGAHPEGQLSDAGSAGFYPTSKQVKKEFAPIIGYCLTRIRQSWPYFWDNADKFDKATSREFGRFITYNEYRDSEQGNARGF